MFVGKDGAQARESKSLNLQAVPLQGPTRLQAVTSKPSQTLLSVMATSHSICCPKLLRMECQTQLQLHLQAQYKAWLSDLASLVSATMGPLRCICTPGGFCIDRLPWMDDLQKVLLPAAIQSTDTATVRKGGYKNTMQRGQGINPSSNQQHMHSCVHVYTPATLPVATCNASGQLQVAAIHNPTTPQAQATRCCHVYKRLCRSIPHNR